MNTTPNDPIADWMRLAQEPMPYPDLEAAVMAEIATMARVRARRRHHLAFAWLSFAVGMTAGLWVAAPVYGNLLTPEVGTLVQVGVSLGLVFGFERLWALSRLNVEV